MLAIFERGFCDLLLWLLGDVGGDAEVLAYSYLDKYCDELDKLVELGLIKRLRNSIQGSLCLRNHVSLGNSVTVPYLEIPKEWNRLFHSVCVGAANAALGCLLGFPLARIHEFAVGGICHDVGHSLFGHIGEGILSSLDDKSWSHEEVGINRIKSDFWLSIWLSRNKISADSLVLILREEGELGQLQRVTDSLMWWLVDSLVSEFYGHSDEDQLVGVVRDVLGSVRGFDDGHIVVDSVLPLRRLLDGRSELIRDIYFSRSADISRSCLGGLLSYAFRQKWFSPDELVSMGSHEFTLISSIDKQIWQVPRPYSTWLFDLRAVFTSGHSLTYYWRTHEFSRPSGAQWFCRYLKPPVAHELALLTTTMCYEKMQKTLNVVCDGELKVLTASPELFKSCVDPKHLVLYPELDSNRYRSL